MSTRYFNSEAGVEFDSRLAFCSNDDRNSSSAMHTHTSDDAFLIPGISGLGKNDWSGVVIKPLRIGRHSNKLSWLIVQYVGIIL